MRRSLDSKAMIRPRLIGTLAVAFATLLVVGCGSSGDQIPTDSAKALNANLDALKEQINADDCDSADGTLNVINDEANTLSGDVESGLRELLGKLEVLFAEQCVKTVPPSDTTSSTTSSSSTTTAEPTSTSTSTSTSTETSTTTDPTSTSTSTTTDPTTPTDTTTPGGGGGGGSGTGGTAPGRNKRGGG